MGQPHLNGAYYGPSIPPPPSKTYHRQGRGDAPGCCCCNPFSCCCSCIMNCICTCICQILCTLLVVAVVAAVAAFVCWLVFRPNTVKFHSSDAALSQFALSNNTLRYNLQLNLTIRNPNKRIGVYYDWIQASAFYQGQRFSTVDLQPFYQGTKSTHNVSAEFKGQNVVVLGNKEMSHYDRDRSSGSYDIDVKLHLRVRLKFWFVKSTRVKPKIDCNLEVPLRNNGSSAAGGVYRSNRCDFDWR